MKLQINLSEDEQLRKLIKEQVIAALKSIIRDEINAIAGEEIKRKIDKVNPYEVAEYEIRSALYREEKTPSGNNSSFLKNIVRQVTAEEVGKLAISEIKYWASDEHLTSIVSFRAVAESILREKIDKITKDLGTLEGLKALVKE